MSGVCDSTIFSLPQSFINQKRKEDEDVSEPLMQKHEQKIRHFGKCAFSIFCSLNLYRICVGLLLIV